jgi:hypothetical protein
LLPYIRTLHYRSNNLVVRADLSMVENRVYCKNACLNGEKQ